MLRRRNLVEIGREVPDPNRGWIERHCKNWPYFGTQAAFI
jgi:hypothetical protein